jgi:hypothetical protein
MRGRVSASPLCYGKDESHLIYLKLQNGKENQSVGYPTQIGPIGAQRGHVVHLGPR